MEADSLPWVLDQVDELTVTNEVANDHFVCEVLLESLKFHLAGLFDLFDFAQPAERNLTAQVIPTLFGVMSFQIFLVLRQK